MPRNRPMELAEARRRAKLTQAGLADLANVARSTVIKIEKGQVPRTDTAARLQEALESRLSAGRIELVLPYRSSASNSQNGETGAPPQRREPEGQNTIARRLDDDTWEISVDAFSWFTSSENDERSSGFFWDSLREFIPPNKPGRVFFAPSLQVTALIHVTSLSPKIAGALEAADETWVHGTTALGLLIACNTFEAGPDAPSWGSITLLPWSVILGISNEHYVAAGARRYPREEAPSAAVREVPPP